MSSFIDSYLFKVYYSHGGAIFADSLAKKVSLSPDVFFTFWGGFNGRGIPVTLSPLES